MLLLFNCVVGVMSWGLSGASSKLPEWDLNTRRVAPIAPPHRDHVSTGENTARKVASVAIQKVASFERAPSESLIY